MIAERHRIMIGEAQHYKQRLSSVSFGNVPFFDFLLYAEFLDMLGYLLLLCLQRFARVFALQEGIHSLTLA